MSYEDLLLEADRDGLIVKEKPLLLHDGRIKGKRIAIRQSIPTLSKKADVLAEELGHYYTSTGDILDQSDVNHRKQERTARLWGFNKRIGLAGIVNAFKANCRNAYEIAEYLDVSEESLKEALEYYRQIYGCGTVVDTYYIRFEPYLQVYKYMMFK